MDRVSKFLGQVQDGRVVLDSRDSMFTAVASLEGFRVEITLKKFRATRSRNQNSWYWAVLTEWGEELGYTKDELHAALRMKFLMQHEDTSLPTIRSTADLTTLEFSHYLDHVIRTAAEMGYVIQDPKPAMQEEKLIPCAEQKQIEATH